MTSGTGSSAATGESGARVTRGRSADGRRPALPGADNSKKRGRGGGGTAGGKEVTLDGGLVVADPVDLEPGHEGGPGAGHLEQADADQHGAADPGDQAGPAAEERERAHRHLEAERHQQERNPQAERVDEGEQGAAGDRAGGGGQRQDGGERGADAGSPAEAEHDAEQRRSGQARLGPGGGAHDAAREREPV